MAIAAAPRRRAPAHDQQALADQLGVHVITVSRWETDRSAPTLSQIRPSPGPSGVPVELGLPAEPSP